MNRISCCVPNIRSVDTTHLTPSGEASREK